MISALKFYKITGLILPLTLFGCGSFQGPGSLKSSGYQPNQALTPARSNDTDTSSNPKRVKIQEDFDHPPKESFDDGSEQNVFEHLPPKAERDAQNKSNPDKKMHFDWPVDEAKLSRGFINRKRKHHWGLDLANKKGTPILAAENGYVVYTGRQFHGYGRLIVIEHNDRWASLYAHLEKFLVKEGDFVKRGQSIGEMGRTGHATGYHLHFELRDNRIPVDPQLSLPAHE